MVLAPVLARNPADARAIMRGVLEVAAQTPTVVVHVQSGGSATLILATAGVVLALAALGWQWYSVTFISGSRISVEIRRALMGLGAVVSFPDDAPDWHLAQAQQQGYTQPMYAVQVNNTARGMTSIVAVDLAFSDGGGRQITQPDPALPYRLEGESEEKWYFEAAPAAAYAATSAKVWPDKARNMTVRGRVKLGSKKVVLSKNAIAVS